MFLGEASRCREMGCYRTVASCQSSAGVIPDTN